MVNIKFFGKEGEKYISCNGIGNKSDSSISDSLFDLHVKTSTLWDELIKYSSSDLSSFFASMIIYDRNSISIDFNEAELNLIVTLEEKYGYSINYYLGFDMYKWSNPYNINDFFKTLKIHLENEDYPIDKISLVNDFVNEIGINLEIPIDINDHTTPIKTILHKYDEALRVGIMKSNNIILASKKENLISILFNFSDDTRTICSQYLIYFGKFMEDLGVDLNTSIEEKGNSVLLSVTPVDKDTAVSKIYDALRIYLEIPKYEYTSTSEMTIQSNQLKANLLHLKSQILLSQSIIQSKNATIESLYFTNHNLQQVIINSKEKIENENEDVIPGLVSVKKYEGNLLSVNLPELLRKIKNMFK